MNIKEMDKFTKHCDKYFEQSDSMVLHPNEGIKPHIDVLLYKPSKKYPFWKLVTMGASDYKMPAVKNALSRRNEYIMFVDPSENLDDSEITSWYYKKLVMIATYAYFEHTFVTYSHSFEWQNDEPDDEMIAAFIEFPQVIENADILRCKLGMFKTTACLQVVLLNKTELDKIMEIGQRAFSEYLYPENDDKIHFISERHRSEKF